MPGYAGFTINTRYHVDRLTKLDPGGTVELVLAPNIGAARQAASHTSHWLHLLTNMRLSAGLNTIAGSGVAHYWSHVTWTDPGEP
jgi:hypothetical protein